MKKSSEILSQNVGVDVSKDSLDVVFSTMDMQQDVKIKASRNFKNTPSGHEQLHKWIGQKRIIEVEQRILMEATGIYYEQLAWYLYDKDYTVSVVLPTKAKRYLQAIGKKSKNDKIDARGLAQMGLEQKLAPWQPISKNIYRLRLLTRQLEDFNNQKTAMMNQKHALGYSAYPVKEVEKNLIKMIKELEKCITGIQKMIEQMICKDEKLLTKAKNILPIKGVGIRTIAVLISETNGFETFENQGQLVSYSGYDIVEHQSGKKVGKTRISKKGNAHIRRAMHLPAFGVVRNQVAPFSSLYDRLIDKGKTKMQAYVAVQRKLLILIWALWKKDQPYDPNYNERSLVNSGNDETKPLFSLSHDTDTLKTALGLAKAAQDELPYKESTEVLFSLT